MTINRQFIGREYPFSADYEVSGELIRRFAAAIGDLHPAYLDRRVAAALGYRDVIAPPTFLTPPTFRFADESPMRINTCSLTTCWLCTASSVSCTTARS